LALGFRRPKIQSLQNLGTRSIKIKVKEHTRKLTWEQRYARELMVQFRKNPPELVKDIRLFPYELGH